MFAHLWRRWLYSFQAPRRGKARTARRGPRPRLESLEDRLAPTIDLNVVVGGTLDVNPVSSIFPSAAYTRMDVLTTTVPGLNHGTMYRVTGTDAIPWGSGPPNTFEPASSPSFNQNRIFGGEGFRYVNDGTGQGETESIPVKFSDPTGFTTANDTLVIHINSPAGAPQIVTQPEGITLIASGQTATLSVQATGTGTLHYQWYSGLTPNASNPIAGATSSTFTTPALTVGGQYLYWVQVSNAVGVANSLNATVQVNEATTTTTSSPADLTYSRTAQTVTLTATVARTVSQLFGIADGAVTFDVQGVGKVGNVGYTVVSPGVDTVTATLTVPGRTHAGTYPITVTYAGNIPLYLAGSSDSATLTILKADQTITGFGALPGKTYGDPDFTITGVSATSDPDAGGVTFTSLNPSVAIVSGSTVEIVGAGTATIVASQAGNVDWNPAPDVQQTLTVKKAPLTVTAHSATKVYGQDNPALTADYSGFVRGDMVSSLGGALTLSTTATASSPVGRYAITPGGLTSTNYDITFVDGTLTVTPAPLTVTPDAGQSKVYGAAVPALAYSAAGFVNGDPASLLSGSLGTTATAASPVGDYAFTLGSLDAGPNYALALAANPPAFAVTPAPLTVTPDAGQSKVYGAAVPSLTYSAAGFVNGDGPSVLGGALGTTATAASPVGDYAFTLGSLDAGPNYALALAANPPAFAVTPAPLTVTADDVTRSYGVANPALTASYSGFVNGDTAAVVSGSPGLTTAATAGSAPGAYPITVDVSALSAANYTFSPVGGTLTVTPAALAAAGVNVSAAVGAPFSGTVATFTNADPFGGPSSYAATIAWGDGSTSAGVITDSGGGTFTVSGSHTYSAAGTDAVGVQVSHNLGYTTPATAGATATVSGDAVIGGTAGDDTLVLTRTPGGAPGDLTYTLNGGPPVQLHGVTSFTFDAGAGDDTMTVSLANGGPLVSGNITFAAGAGTDTLNVDAAGLPVGITPGNFRAGGQLVSFADVESTRLDNAGAAGTFPGPDTADRATAFAGLDAAHRFVQALYLDALGRPGSAAELDGWVGLLNSPGGSRAAVADGIERSPEARDRLVKGWYLAFLGRQASQGEELGWVNRLLGGQTEAEVLGDILGDANRQEFFTRAQTLAGTGSPEERFVQALYQAVLGRAGSPAEVAGWVAALPQLGTQGLARALLGGAESRTYLAEACYNVLLHRPADAGLADWASSTLDATAMRVAFESSDEFFANG